MAQTHMTSKKFGVESGASTTGGMVEGPGGTNEAAERCDFGQGQAGYEDSIHIDGTFCKVHFVCI